MFEDVGARCIGVIGDTSLLIDMDWNSAFVYHVPIPVRPTSGSGDSNIMINSPLTYPSARFPPSVMTKWILLQEPYSKVTGFLSVAISDLIS